MRHFDDEELAVLARIVERLEVWQEEYAGTDAVSSVLVEEELILIREIVDGGVGPLA